MRGWYRLSEAVGRQGGYTLAADGVLVTPETGRYRFALECQGDCGVSIGGHELLRGDESTEIALSAGTTSLGLRLVGDERPFLRLAWHRPTWLELATLDDAVGLDVSAREFGRTERRRAVRVIALAILFAGAALLGVRLAAAAAGWRAGVAAAARARWAEPVMRRALVAGLVAMACVATLRTLASRNAPDGLHVHEWTGEYLMQTVSAADLRIEPFRSLFYLHIQPPALDALRALSVWRHAALDGFALLDAVDRDVYRGLGAGRRTAGGARLRLVAQARRAARRHHRDGALHPAPGVPLLRHVPRHDVRQRRWLHLDHHEIWRMARERGSPARLALAMSLVFLTRSIVQWPFIVVASVALARLRQWLSFISTELHPWFSILLSGDAAAPVRDHAIAAIETKLAWLDTQLGEGYLLDTFTVADAFLITVLNWAQATTIDLSRWPAVAAYLARGLKRPSVTEAIATELPLYLKERQRMSKP